MALKFRRGTTAQKSGSLAFGEPYVNTSLGTLEIGLDTGDIILAPINGLISGSSQVSYPQLSNIPSGIISSSAQIDLLFDIDGLVSGSSQVTLQSTTGFSAYDTALATITGSLISSASADRVSITNINSATASLIVETTNLETFSASALTRLSALEVETSNLETFSGSQLTQNSNLATITGSLISSASTAKTTNDSQGVSITNLNSYTSSLQAGIQLTGSTVSFLGDIVVYGTQSIINSENLAVNDNLIYLNEGSTITNPDLGIVGNYNDGTYAHTGIFRDASDSGTWKVFKGYTPEPSGTIDTAHASFALADFKAEAFTGTSFSGQILSTNGVVSGSSQVIGILSSLNTYTGSNDTTNTTQNTRLTALEASASTALSTNNTQATSITNLNSATASLMIETANLEAFSASALTRLSDLEGKDISITLTGDVTGTGTITNLANVSFATTISANSVALGTDTTGDYVASLVAGTGVTLSNNSGEGATPTVAIGQSVATNATPTFGNLTINGTITATGDITAYYTSDRRHKNNIQTISNAVLKVKQLNGVTWEWNDDVNEVTKSTPKTGLIAQEVQSVLPQVVTERNDGFLALDYSKMVGLLVEAIKEQQIQIDQLKAQIGSK
jgi:hypothetical protein